MLETSVLTGQFASKIGLQKHGELIGLLHDLGKASAEFDKYIRSAAGLIDPDADEYVNADKLKGKIDHSSAGAQVIHRYFSEKGMESLFAAQIMSLTIASHHSGLIDCLTPEGEDNYSRRMKKTDELTRTGEAEANMNENIRQELRCLFEDRLLVEQINNKIKNLKESNDSTETLMFKVGLLTRFLFSCLIDADRINTADFEFPGNKILRNQGEYVPWNSLVQKLEQHITRFRIDNRANALLKEISSLRFALYHVKVR